jgi:hypothetical protein
LTGLYVGAVRAHLVKHIAQWALAMLTTWQEDKLNEENGIYGDYG